MADITYQSALARWQELPEADTSYAVSGTIIIW